MAVSDNRSIYVGDLARDVTEAQLTRKFAALGPVISVKICTTRQKAGKESLAHAFVNFRHRSHAQKALTTLHFKPMGKANIPMRLMWYAAERSEESNLYIKNIEKSIDCRSLHTLMAPFGNILSCKIAKDSRGVSLGHGFVQFENEEDAQAAIEEMNGAEIRGMELYVGKFVPKQERTHQLSESMSMDHGNKKKKMTAKTSPSGSKSTARPVTTVSGTPPSEKSIPQLKTPEASKSMIEGPETPVNTSVNRFKLDTAVIENINKPEPKMVKTVESKVDKVVKASLDGYERIPWPISKSPAERYVVVPVSQERMPNIFGGIGSRPSMQPEKIHTYRDALTVAPIPEGDADSQIGMRWLDVTTREYMKGDIHAI